jgi:hypothetical protein
MFVFPRYAVVRVSMFQRARGLQERQRHECADSAGMM